MFSSFIARFRLSRFYRSPVVRPSYFLLARVIGDPPVFTVESILVRLFDRMDYPHIDSGQLPFWILGRELVGSGIGYLPPDRWDIGK